METYLYYNLWFFSALIGHEYFQALLIDGTEKYIQMSCHTNAFKLKLLDSSSYFPFLCLLFPSPLVKTLVTKTISNFTHLQYPTFHTKTVAELWPYKNFNKPPVKSSRFFCGFVLLCLFSSSAFYLVGLFTHIIFTINLSKCRKKFTDFIQLHKMYRFTKKTDIVKLDHSIQNQEIFYHLLKPIFVPPKDI